MKKKIKPDYVRKSKDDNNKNNEISRINEEIKKTEDTFACVCFLHSIPDNQINATPFIVKNMFVEYYEKWSNLEFRMPDLTFDLKDLLHRFENGIKLANGCPVIIKSDGNPINERGITVEHKARAIAKLFARINFKVNNQYSILLDFEKLLYYCNYYHYSYLCELATYVIKTSNMPFVKFTEILQFDFKLYDKLNLVAWEYRE